MHDNQPGAEESHCVAKSIRAMMFFLGFDV